MMALSDGLHLLAVCAGFAMADPGTGGQTEQSRAPFEPLYRKAYEARRHQSGDDHPDTITSLVRWGALLRAHGRFADAAPLLRAALSRLDRAGPPDEQVLLELAQTMAALGQHADAEELYTRALEVSDSALGNARTLLRLAALRAAHGNASGAQQAYRGSLEQFASASSLTDAQLQIRATALNDLGLLLEAEGDLPEAEATFRQAMEAHVEAFGDDHPGTAAARANLAGLLARGGEMTEAAGLLEQALDVFRMAYGPHHDNTAGLRNRLGEVYEVQGRLEDAEAEYTAAVAAWPEQSTSRGLALADLGRLAGVRHDFTLAAQTLTEAVKLLRRAPADRTMDLAEALDAYGSALRALNRLHEAAEVLREALALREQELGTAHPETALTLVGLAGVMHLQGELGSAEPMYQQALTSLERALGPDHPEIGEALYNLAHLQQAVGQGAAAASSFRRSAEILSAAYGSDDPFVLQIRAAIRALR